VRGWGLKKSGGCVGCQKCLGGACDGGGHGGQFERRGRVQGEFFWVSEMGLAKGSLTCWL